MLLVHDTKEAPSSPRTERCIELRLLMPGWQWAALEEAARRRGLTVGQLLRRLIAAYLAENATHRDRIRPGRPSPSCT